MNQSWKLRKIFYIAYTCIVFIFIDEDTCWNLEFGKNLKVGETVYNQDCSKISCVAGEKKENLWRDNYLIKYK